MVEYTSLELIGFLQNHGIMVNRCGFISEDDQIKILKTIIINE